MIGLFVGTHDNKIDGKGRLSIPAQFRELLRKGDPDCGESGRPQMLLVLGDDSRDYIEVLTVKSIRRVAKQIFALPPGSEERRRLEHIYFETSTEATVDETGRIVLNARFRTKLGLTDQATVVGVGREFRIWHPQTKKDADTPPPAPEGGPREDARSYLQGDEDDDFLV